MGRGSERGGQLDVAYGSAMAGAQRALTGQSEPCEDIFFEPVIYSSILSRAAVRGKIRPQAPSIDDRSALPLERASVTGSVVAMNVHR